MPSLKISSRTGSPAPRDSSSFLWQHLREGLFCDPIHGGNQGMAGWRLIGFPGAQFGYSADEQRLDVVIRREPRSVAQLQAERDEREGEPSGAS